MTLTFCHYYNVGMAASLGTFEQAVLLSVYRLRDEAYGRPIIKDVGIRLRRKVSAGAAYATLARLEARGLISSRLAEGTTGRGGRARRFYRLERDGVLALNEARTLVTALWQGVRRSLA